MTDSQTSESFTISLKGEGIDIQRQVSLDKLSAVLGVIMGSDFPSRAAPSSANTSANGRPVKMSLREFLDDVKATKKPDQIVAIGQYMSLHEEKDTFSRDDIKTRFQSAREPLPANFPRDFSAAAAKGMIAEDHAKSGQYYVTKTGVQIVERRFGAKL